MRWIVCMVVVAVGCVASMPGGHDISADLAVETARMVVQMRNEIRPTPQSDECENCRGTGKVGDGTIVSTCQVCGGTGRNTKSICIDCEKK